MKSAKTIAFTLLLPQKFLILGLIAAILVTIPFGFYFNAMQGDIAVVQNEINGIKPSISLQTILQLTQQHRGLSNVVLGGSGEAIKPARKAMAEEVEAAIAAMDSIIKESIPDEAIGKNWTASVQRWRKLEAGVNQAQVGANYSFQEHSALIADYFVVMDQVADFFELSLDSDAASYFMMRATLYAIPRLTESMGRTRGLGAGLLSLKQASPEQIAALSGFIGSSRDNQVEIFNQLAKVYALRPDVKGPLEPLSLTANKLYQTATKLAEDEIITKQQLSYDSKVYFDAYTVSINALFDLNKAGMAKLNELLIDRKSTLRNEQILVSTGIGLLFALGALVAYRISRGVTSPINHLVDVMQKLAVGETNVRANMQSFDEVGLLGRQFDMMIDQRELVSAQLQKENDVMNNSIIEMLQAAGAIAQRDLTIKAPVAEDITGPLGDALNYLTDETAKVLNNVVRIAGEVARASTQVKSQSDTVIGIATEEKLEAEQSAAELSVASEEMRNIAQLAVACNDAATKAIKNTDKAQATVLGTVEGITSIRDTIRETEKRIKRLGERSQEIGSVVAIINNIAERTHILALNASMHAASAGEAGKGFAVVANEVQKLAENARGATSQISGLVNNIRLETVDTVTTMNDAIAQVVKGTTLAQQAGNEMKATRDATAELVQLVQQIAEGAQTQAETSEKLRERAVQIQATTERTFQQLQEQGKQTDRLVGYSGNLVESVGVFKLPAAAGYN